MCSSDLPEQVRDGDLLGDNGHILVGDRGLIVSSNWPTWQLYPEKLAREYGEPPKKLPRSPGHHQEWINACKGGATAGSHFDWAGPLTETVLLGNVALRMQLREKLTRVKLKWDAARLEFTNLPEANSFLRREYRSGWSL